MNLILGVVVGVLILSFLVIIHELGHAIVAHRNGVVVEEFAVGFPPTIWAKKLKMGVKVKINAILLGGYVKLQGEYDAASQSGDYGKASYWAKTKILFAGVALNLVCAWAIFSILAVFGLPKILPNQIVLEGDDTITSPVLVQSLESDGPAEQAGLLAGDELIAIDGQAVDSPDHLRQITTDLAGQTAEFRFRREGVESSVLVDIRGKDKLDEQGFSGIYPSQTSVIKTKWYRAPVLGLATTGQLAAETLKSIGRLISDFLGGIAQKLSFNATVREQGSQSLARASDSVAGPLQLLGIIFPALMSADFTILLFFVAIISLTLAVFNSLPIPGLDGGRWFVTTVFKLLKKPLTKEREEKIQSTGVMVLLTLTLIIIISDVTKII